MAEMLSKTIGKLLVKPGLNVWLRIEEGNENGEMLLKVGLMKSFVNFVGPIEFIRLLPEGKFVASGHPFGSIEHGMRIALLRSPVSGWIVKVNKKVKEYPELINEDPYGEGWLVIIRPVDFQRESQQLIEVEI